MKVRMKTTYATERGTAGPGGCIDLPDSEAEQLIAGKYAEPAEPPRRKALAIEKAPAPEETSAEESSAETPDADQDPKDVPARKSKKKA